MDHETLEATIFGPEFLLERPLLRAIRSDESPVLLIDEIDRADEEFEAFLLELLSDFQISIPELGTLQAKSRPVIVLTSNGTRELSDALRRRCLYLWIDYPDPEKELAILNLRLPDIAATRTAEAVRLSQRLRGERLSKPPGVAETIDFAAALDTLDDGALVPETARAALGTLIKDAQDLAQLTTQRLEEILAPRADIEGETPTE